MSLTQTVYNAVFKRTSTFALAIVVGAVFFERCFDQLGDGLYNYINQGKQFKDLRKEIALREAGEDD
ncbi:putative cytochrome b-c1 complex subunit 9-like [Apostichopus japonicus]|uniref:Complex III subunit 9 n=1 Tax=Stichopus japonicus TaxID=307972 RepID=A0A2G8L0F9_STIJA|nr:putative cytochrome b-c1 complex subunit 9-like [Apostichopus japonicus]